MVENSWSLAAISCALRLRRDLHKPRFFGSTWMAFVNSAIAASYPLLDQCDALVGMFARPESAFLLRAPMMICAKAEKRLLPR